MYIDRLETCAIGGCGHGSGCMWLVQYAVALRQVVARTAAVMMQYNYNM